MLGARIFIYEVYLWSCLLWIIVEINLFFFFFLLLKEWSRFIQKPLTTEEAIEAVKGFQRIPNLTRILNFGNAWTTSKFFESVISQTLIFFRVKCWLKRSYWFLRLLGRPFWCARSYSPWLWRDTVVWSALLLDFSNSTWMAWLSSHWYPRIKCDRVIGYKICIRSLYENKVEREVDESWQWYHYQRAKWGLRADKIRKGGVNRSDVSMVLW